MTLTPLDIEKLELRTGFRGYAREDVERFRYDVLRSVEDYLARIGALQARVSELERDLQQYRANEDLLKSSVVLAQRTSDELITAARQRADLIIREAEAEGEVIRRRLTDIRNEREQFEYAFHGLLSGFLHRLEQGNPELKPVQKTQPAALSPRGESSPKEDTATYSNQLVGDQAAEQHNPFQDEPGSEAAGSHDLGFTIVQPKPVAAQPEASPRPAAPAMPSRAAGTTAPANERDADINSFSAALDSAKVRPGPPRVSAREHGIAPQVEAPAHIGEPVSVAQQPQAPAEAAQSDMQSDSMEQGADQAAPLRDLLGQAPGMASEQAKAASGIEEPPEETDGED